MVPKTGGGSVFATLNLKEHGTQSVIRNEDMNCVHRREMDE